MVFDPLSFPSLPSEPSPSSPRPASAASEAAFAEIYSEAVTAANQEMAQILSSDSPNSDGLPSDGETAGFLDLRASSPFALSNLFAPAGDDVSATQAELMQLVASIRPAQTNPTSGIERPASSVPVAAPTGQPAEGAPPSGIRRLISWLDAHAHLHSSHRCAASVRQAMEAAGIPTADRPVSGDAGDYGPFLLRHGAQVISAQSWQPQAGDIAVFDRTGDHPAGHIQVFDGQHWVSDFVQHGFSPYLDQASTPPVTVYRLS